MSETNAAYGSAGGKAADAFRSIGEVSEMLAIKPHVLRYWEEQFPMLRPLKRAGGRRHYRPEDIALLQTIDRLVHHEGFTLRGARQLLEGKSAETRAPEPEAAPAPAPAPIDLARLQAARDRLAAALVD